MAGMKTLKCFNSKLIMVLFSIILIRSCENESLYYILQWTYLSNHSWIYSNLETGQEPFLLRNCSFQNCFVTSNRSYFVDIIDFDVLLFNSVHLRDESYNYDLPLNRSERQLYIFVGFEPAMYHAVPGKFEGFFNLTWTYKLASDIFHPYFVVKNQFGNIIGPKSNTRWMDFKNLTPRNMSVGHKLRTKRIAAAWVVSACYQKRLNFTESLRNELLKYGLQIDVYGYCGNLSCPAIPKERSGLLTNCYSKIESDYYFYLAFENSLTEDYVTEKVLHGLQHFAVPVVYGGADYTRFLPDGTYLNALKLGVTKLAKDMSDIINDPPRYYDFFKWHGYYSFYDTAENRNRYSICKLCAYLNDEERRYKRTVYKSITQWWNAGETSIHKYDPTSADDKRYWNEPKEIKT